ncbi:filamentous hemagglutinin N-terminal domain-containing protein, partial [Candidatus Halobeggiatoa sp. HSG11]|nr:filamentous hemagglutinin N-terminal domain-containing protein [Candidatus Halobeggiatoa sp. HSG11]
LNMIFYCITIFLSILFIPIVYADVVLDGTLGPQVELTGPNFAVEAKLGQQHGSNLFHSFSQFDINKGEIAIFSGPNNINNIISRVTGGQMSNIDGTLQSTIPYADFYFLNPHGIMFGPNAKLDIQGSFHASTADTLSLGTTGQFAIRQPKNSLLTVAPPKAFGFLTDNPASITLQDSTLSISEGKTLSLIGGDLNMSGKLLSISGIGPTVKRKFTTHLEAPNGRINLVSISSKAQIIPTESGLDIITDNNIGYFIIDHSKITTSSTGGGDIFIRAGQFKLINSDITGDTFGEQKGGVVDVLVKNAILDGAENYSLISSNTFGTGHGGKINMYAKKLTSSNGVAIVAGTIDSGNAGSIFMKIDDTLNFSGGFIYEALMPSGFNSSTIGTGKGGNIEVEAYKLNLINGVQIGSGTFSSANSGNVSIKVKDSITISGKDDIGSMSGIYASTQPYIIIDSTYNTGDGGNVEVEANKINLSDGGLISTSSDGLGNAGVINIKTNELTASGKMFSDYWRREFYSGILSSSSVADAVGGQAGNVIVHADKINLSNEGEISTSAKNSGGGNIDIKSTDLINLQGGQISTSVKSGIGDGGNINIENPLFIVLNSEGKIKAQADVGHGGNINIKSDNLIQSPNSLISASSRLGLDGNIRIESPDIDMEGFLTILSDGFVDASAFMKTPCSQRLGENLNSFIVIESEGRHDSPDDLLPGGPPLPANAQISK